MLLETLQDSMQLLMWPLAVLALQRMYCQQCRPVIKVWTIKAPELWSVWKVRPFLVDGTHLGMRAHYQTADLQAVWQVCVKKGLDLRPALCSATAV